MKYFVLFLFCLTPNYLFAGCSHTANAIQVQKPYSTYWYHFVNPWFIQIWP